VASRYAGEIGPVLVLVAGLGEPGEARKVLILNPTERVMNAAIALAERKGWTSESGANSVTVVVHGPQ
jgi:hypothetical protein